MRATVARRSVRDETNGDHACDPIRLGGRPEVEHHRGAEKEDDHAEDRRARHPDDDHERQPEREDEQRATGDAVGRPAGLGVSDAGERERPQEGVARGDGRGRPFLPQKCTEGGTADAAEVEGEVVLRPARRHGHVSFAGASCSPCVSSSGPSVGVRPQRRPQSAPGSRARSEESIVRTIRHPRSPARCRSASGDPARGKGTVGAAPGWEVLLRRGRTIGRVRRRSLRGAIPRGVPRPGPRCARVRHGPGPPSRAVGRTRGPPTASRRRPPPRPPPPRRRAARSLRGRGLREAAGVADDHRTTTRGRLDEDVPPALHLESGEAGPARHREDVSDGVVAGQVLFGHLAHERDRARRRVLRERPEGRLEGPGADDQQPRLRHPSLDRAHRSDQAASCPFRRTSRLTQTIAGGRPARAVPDVGGGQIRAEPLDIGARMEHRDRHVLRHGGPYPAGDELATPGHPRRGRRHPLHDGMGDRHRRSQ